MKAKVLLLEGQAAPATRKALEARGWQISENVQLAAQKADKAGGRPGATPVGVGSGVVR